MAEFDYAYLSRLVEQTRGGSSAAFAELYAATYQKQYQFACSFLEDETLAKDAVQETYIYALKSIDNLSHPRLFVSWLNQISFKTCFRLSLQQSRTLRDDPEMTPINIDGHEYLLKQIMNLPLSEAQAIAYRYIINMSVGEISRMMDTSRSSVKRYIESGKDRLNKVLQK